MAEQSSEQLKFAGDVNIDKVQLTNSRGLTQNITNQVLSIEYYEDIFQPFLTGSLVVRDTLDLTNVFKFMGEEFVEIEFSTPTLGKPIKNLFYVHKMTDRTVIGDSVVVYELHFTSPEILVDVNKKISQKFNGRLTDVVERLLKDKSYGLETSKNCNIETCGNTKTWISPYWSPVKNIQYAADYAEDQTNCPNYIFFENNNGFNFVSINALITNRPYQIFTKDKYTRDTNTDGSSSPNPSEDYKRITDFSIPEVHDFIENVRSGMYASRAMSFDVTKKQYTAKNFNAFGVFARHNHLNENPTNSLSSVFRPSASLVYRPKMTANFAGTGDNSNFSSLQARISAMKSINAHRIEISVPGRTDYVAGMVVRVELQKSEPVSEADENNDLADRMFSGNYLISAIHHTVKRDGHECHMELIKDSLMADPNQVGTN
jgi:hypothetical protein